MQRHTAAPNPNPLRCFPALVAATFLLTLPCHAQQPEAPPGDDPIYTLHAYTNLVQLPTLVLDAYSKPLPPIPRDRFALRLDGGPVFHPTAMHIEGDDPISLAILLDASGEQNDLLKNFDDTLTAVASAHLLPHDNVSIYAIDCNLIGSAKDIPANSPALKSAVSTALVSPALHGQRGKGCAGDIHLRDSLIWIATTLADSPSRRVILALTSGKHDQSSKSWDDAKYNLAARGVALFAITSDTYSRLTASPLISTVPRVSDEQLLRTLCERTGGILVNTSPEDLQPTLTNLIALLRGRYIIEFPHPDEHRPGSHQIDIAVPGTHDFVVHTGATVPLPDLSLLNDPNTVHTTTKSPAVYGNHKPDPHP